MAQISLAVLFILVPPILSGTVFIPSSRNKANRILNYISPDIPANVSSGTTTPPKIPAFLRVVQGGYRRFSPRTFGHLANERFYEGSIDKVPSIRHGPRVPGVLARVGAFFPDPDIPIPEPPADRNADLPDPCELCSSDVIAPCSTFKTGGSNANATISLLFGFLANGVFYERSVDNIPSSATGPFIPGSFVVMSVFYPNGEKSPTQENGGPRMRPLFCEGQITAICGSFEPGDSFQDVLCGGGGGGVLEPGGQIDTPSIRGRHD